MYSSSTLAPRENESALSRQNFVENLQLFSWSLPAILLIALLVVLPMACLFWLSIVGADGFSLVNYQNLLQPTYGLTLLTTFKLAFIVTAVCAVLGYPLSYVAAQLSPKWSRLIILCVLFPLWTSLLVRMYAWLVLMRRHGLVNNWLQHWGIIDEPLRLAYSFTGSVIGMVHIMLPFMVLPLFSSMRTIDETYMRAAASLGAGPIKAFWQIYARLSLSGLGAGTLIVFIFSLGFYVTPAILGGGRVMTWAMQVQNSLTIYADWGVASALGVVLLAGTLAILWLFGKVVGTTNNSMGAR